MFAERRDDDIAVLSLQTHLLWLPACLHRFKQLSVHDRIIKVRLLLRLMCSGTGHCSPAYPSAKP